MDHNFTQTLINDRDGRVLESQVLCMHRSINTITVDSLWMNFPSYLLTFSFIFHHSLVLTIVLSIDLLFFWLNFFEQKKEQIQKWGKLPQQSTATVYCLCIAFIILHLCSTIGVRSKYNINIYHNSVEFGYWVTCSMVGIWATLFNCTNLSATFKTQNHKRKHYTICCCHSCCGWWYSEFLLIFLLCVSLCSLYIHAYFFGCAFFSLEFLIQCNRTALNNTKIITFNFSVASDSDECGRARFVSYTHS